MLRDQIESVQKAARIFLGLRFAKLLKCVCVTLISGVGEGQQNRPQDIIAIKNALSWTGHYPVEQAHRNGGRMDEDTPVKRPASAPSFKTPRRKIIDGLRIVCCGIELRSTLRHVKRRSTINGTRELS
jgi:hypothetical protein